MSGSVYTMLCPAASRCLSRSWQRLIVGACLDGVEEGRPLAVGEREYRAGRVLGISDCAASAQLGDFDALTAGLYPAALPPDEGVFT